jgi:uncharacterized protein YggE
MNRMWWTGVAAPLLVASSVWADDEKPKAPDRTITVTGAAEVKTPPDQAQIILGVCSFHKELLEAKKENDAKISKMLAAFAELKLDPSDFCTTDVNVASEYAVNDVGDKRLDKFLGYKVTNQLSVTLKDFSKLSLLIMKSMQAGANEVESLSFGTTKLLESRNEARRLAIRAARDKALLLANEIGQKIGKARTINETSSGSSGTFQVQRGGGGGGGLFGGGGDTESREVIASGQLEIAASVVVTFDLE